MPEFQRKTYKFTHKGMNWNGSADNVPEGQVCYARNVRVTQQGTVTQRPGLTGIVGINGGTTGVSYIHSSAVLNNFNPELIDFTKVYVIAGHADPDLNYFFVGDSAINLTDTSINPIALPRAGSPHFTDSGLPVSFVDMAPVGSNVGWKYVGDSNLNFSIGYYPGDTTNPGSGPNKGMARAISMGMTPPINLEFPYEGDPGPLLGDYQWCFAYRNKYTGARSNPRAATRQSIEHPALTLSNATANFSTPITPIDPQTNRPDTNIVVDIYRFGGTLPTWNYIGTEQGGTPYNDNTADADIETAPGPPQIKDAVTGVSRFNLYRPFLMQANALYSTSGATVSLDPNSGVFLLTADPNDDFDLNWLQGTPISVNNAMFSIYQVRSNAVIELAQDATGTLAPGGKYPWATQTGSLVMGQPLPHIWGPYGLGQGGAFIFGCGGSTAPGIPTSVDRGTLYWTNGNDPDSTDLTNSLIVTSPSEPLMGGCIYDGTPFCWTTERLFRIYPGSIAGQFTVQEVPGGKGIFAEYSLTVQSTGNPVDQSITWVSKDGIYDWSVSNGLVSLTDQSMYPFFPHDNQPGLPVSSIFPTSLLTEPHPVTAPDFSPAMMRFHRLCWFMGELFYDFPMTGGGFSTLVFDSKQANGWVSVDQYSDGATIAAHPVSRGIEIAGSNMMVAVSNGLSSYTGTTDLGTTIPCRLVTRQDDLGDPRIQKLWGDYMFDAAAGTIGNVTITPLLNYGLNAGQVQTFAAPSRTQQIYPLSANGLGSLTSSFGFDLSWNAISAADKTRLYQFELGFVPKPELTATRATDRTDDGYLGAKYLRGLCIECNTFNQTRTVDVLVDGVAAGTLSVTANGQLELPFAITPVAGSEFQIHPTDTSSTWEIFGVRWVWDKFPDLDVIQSSWLDLGTTKPKYIRAFTVPISGPSGVPLSFTVTYDGITTVTTPSVTPSSLTAKSPAQYSLNPPILAHQLKLTPSTPCRVFYDEIKWDAEEWPENAILYGPVENLGTSGAKYLRGFELPIETGGNSVTMELLYDAQSATTGTTQSFDFPGVETTALSKNVFPLTPNPPIIAHQFQLRSLFPARYWYSEVKWDFEPWPEYDTGRSPWLNGGTISAKFVRGITIPIDTNGLPVSFTLVTDTGVTVSFGPFNTITAFKTSVYCGFSVPLIFHEFQLSPNSQCRIWFDEIKWDAEEWPELEVESSPWLDNGTPSAKYVRGITMPIDSAGSAVTFDLFTDTGQQVTFGPFTTGVSVKTSVYCGFAVPLIFHQFRIAPRTNCRCWYSEIKWDADPWPESEIESSSWGDGGYPGAKFVQGVLIPMDSGGAPITFDVIYDGGATVAGPFTTVAGRKTTVAYSFPVPFICHNLMLTPRSACSVFYDEVKWVFEPEPELVTTYTTQPTNHDLVGYHYLFDGYIAYIGSADAPSFTVTTEFGSVTYPLPISNGVYTRAYLLLQPQKSKWKSYSITSTGGIRLFLKDCEIRAKNWTDKGNYPSAFTSHQPFGALSRIAGALI